MPPQQPVTPVVINYNYGSVPPPSPDQGVGRAPANASEDNTVEPSHYLIAFKDHTIYAATAYWVDGDTLHRRQRAQSGLAGAGGSRFYGATQ
jgi:hypothetical protein